MCGRLPHSHMLPLHSWRLDQHQITRYTIWPVATHDCESWTLRKPDRWKIDEFELKIYWWLLRILWTAKRSSDSVLQELGTDRQLLKSIMKRKLGYFGHIMRCPGEFLEKTVIQGCIEESRARGRLARIWINDILEATNCTLGQLLRLRRPPVMEREMIHSASNHQY